MQIDSFEYDWDGQVLAVLGNGLPTISFRSSMATNRLCPASKFIEYDTVTTTVNGWPATTVPGASVFTISAAHVPWDVTTLGTKVKATNATRRHARILSRVLTKSKQKLLTV